VRSRWFNQIKKDLTSNKTTQLWVGKTRHGAWVPSRWLASRHIPKFNDLSVLSQELLMITLGCVKESTSDVHWYAVVAKCKMSGHTSLRNGVRSTLLPWLAYFVMQLKSRLTYSLVVLSQPRCMPSQLVGLMMMMAFITIHRGFVSLIEGLCAQIFYFRFEIISGLCSHPLLFFFERKNIFQKKTVCTRSHPAS